MHKKLRRAKNASPTPKQKRELDFSHLQPAQQEASHKGLNGESVFGGVINILDTKKGSK